MKNYRFIDSDAHVFEPEDLWDRYLEPEYKGVIQSVINYAGDPLAFGERIEVQGFVYPNDGIDPSAPLSDVIERIPMPGLGDAYEEYARENFPPRIYGEAMDRHGIDYMVIYPTVGLFATTFPSLDAATAAAIRRAYNNWLYDFCSEAGARVLGAGSIDLRDAEEAAREARRCVKELGFKAIHVNPTPVGEYRLYDKYYDRLWAEISDLDVPVGVHVGAGNPSDSMLFDYLPGLRAAQGIVAFTIGNQIASTSFIMGGVLERHPKLRLVHLESGAGWVAFWLDRMGSGINGAFRDSEIAGLKLHPIEYFQRQCYISSDQDDPTIKYVIDIMGDDNIVTATDFSHPEGRRYGQAVEQLLELPGVSDESKRKILWDNALKLYPIDPDP